ncbi:MAG: ABC transporter ATP-binding protein/permease [Anaerolineae bacterium]|nr:ABC transporter ATP-binding protein/permease [Anaerolineae bacterium]MCO5204692.1 ABC transporter ATP-binding protein/permease [Anaerolineae bacterium]
MKDDASLTPAFQKKDDTGKILGRLVTYMAGGEAKGRFIIALIMRISGLIGLILLPTFTGQAINVASDPNGSVAELQMWILYAFIAGIVYLTLSWFAERIFSDLATKGLFKLQTALFNHMQTLSLTFFDRQPLGQLLSRVSNDTEAVALFYEQAVAQIIRAIAQISLIVIVMLIVDWRLAIAALLIVPVMLILTSIIQRASTPAFAKMQETMGDLSGFQEETISGHKVIISNRRQDWATQANEQLAGGVFDVGSKAYFTSLLQMPLTSALVVLQIVIVLIVGAFLVIDGQTTLGVVISFTGYAALLSGPLSEIANLTSTTLTAVAGGRRVFAIMDEQPTIVDAPDANDYEYTGGRIEFKDVDFSYVPGRKILKHNTFVAEPGQKIGICGPTGAGKSTIMNILTRYYDIDSGTILIDGQNLEALTQVSLREQVGMVLQEAFLFSDTVMNNLKYARDGATDEECIAAAKQANAHEFIVNLPQGYNTMMIERGSNLSQGQRQMITIARAMVANPKIMILDEATSNVDTRTEKLIQEGLNRLMEGRTSFVIAHRLSTIRDSHKIMVLNGGEIVEMDSHDNLMAAKGFYYALYMSQFKGHGPESDQRSATTDWIST